MFLARKAIVTELFLACHMAAKLVSEFATTTPHHNPSLPRICVMSAKITTKFGRAGPPAPRHAVTVYMGSDWESGVEYGTDAASVIARFYDAYPRMKPHRDIVQLSDAVMKHLGSLDKACLLFPSLQSARECGDYATSSRRNDGIDNCPVAVEDVTIRAFVAKEAFFAVIFPAVQYHVVVGFWKMVGAGITSRFAEANCAHLDELRQVALEDAASNRDGFECAAHETLRRRILSLVQRAALRPDVSSRVTTGDIYLYQSGMASIYKPHTYMLNQYQGASVLFGMSFMDTILTLEQFGPGSTFFGCGSEQDLVELESHLGTSRSGGQKVQAIWVEFPANPLLRSPDIAELRRLATAHDAVLVIDDTIGSWANTDVLAMADMTVTSLTKSFNGYADAIGGAAILNPASAKYAALKALFDAQYVPEMHVLDAETFERNSRDYLPRSARLNANASAVVAYLRARAQDPDSSVRRVHYPSVSDTYRAFMRPATADFAPGYGCLLSVEMADLDAARAFYNNLDVHKGVHFGAPFTLAIAYAVCVYLKKEEWAARFGLKQTQIRIAIGLEDTDALLEDFRVAVEAADQAKSTGSSQ
ncbi:Cystathionine gamma-synthase, converts cysteine into cystathionine [Cordyceps militaris CM01]|uniref:Cystathionine gamma-synthase, converts cysteine into cystathionine n=1 Tax=Cordyceps militaris (strain CM01) TaxID=983644 RepID=G3JSK1_CORMM|nr:Cystathionine gamma-synthase, converts cysteine into cystathionine [Cordyceps militaris CM01]EGX88847.1 Cystathionine gamma-synthase, converts cysteine into cystathionine [Cordyceps militaris CM01]